MERSSPSGSQTKERKRETKDKDGEIQEEIDPTPQLHGAVTNSSVSWPPSEEKDTLYVKDSSYHQASTRMQTGRLTEFPSVVNIQAEQVTAGNLKGAEKIDHE